MARVRYTVFIHLYYRLYYRVECSAKKHIALETAIFTHTCISVVAAFRWFSGMALSHAAFRANNFGKPLPIQCICMRRKLLAARIVRENARLFARCISVTGKVKINEQMMSIATGPLYVHTEFELSNLEIWWFLTAGRVIGPRDQTM